jgi:cytochrome c-type biogenesis protein CcmF
MTEAAIDSGLTRDLYISLGEFIDDKTFTVRVYHKPFVDWIWAGCLFMALGGLMAVADRRYRVKVKQAQGAGPDAPAGPGPQHGARLASPKGAA